MRICKNESGQVVETIPGTAPPSSGLYCARDEKGVPVSESGRLQESAPAPEIAAPPRGKRAAPTSTEQ